MRRPCVIVAGFAVVAAAASARDLTSVYVVPAVANTLGEAGTDWHTDLTFNNPQGHSLPVLVQFLPSNRDNSGGVPSVTFTVQPRETLDLWNVLGPNGFDAPGAIGALLVYPDPKLISCSGTWCDFALVSRTYTLNPGGEGEFGQAIPGFPAALGVDASVLAYLPQVSNTPDFRTNLGVASWTGSGVLLRADVQDVDGTIVERSDHYVPPFGHVQWRMSPAVEGGSVVVYLVSGPADAMVYPYASVVDRPTGDPAYVEAQCSSVGFSTARAAVRRPPAATPPRLPVPGFDVERLRRPPL
jgi:hypothetical protein